MPGTPVSQFHRRWAVLFALAVVLVLPAADDPPAEIATVPSDPVFTAHLLDGSAISGQIRELGGKDELVLLSTDAKKRSSPGPKLTRDGESFSLANEHSARFSPATVSSVHRHHGHGNGACSAHPVSDMTIRSRARRWS